jgi:RimJ/RimL family protein N-acetyltransferase
MIITERLRLRLWRDEDLPHFAALNADRRVMQYMPRLLDRSESDAFAEHIGMTHSPEDDFEHPLLAEGHPLRHHVLYRLRGAIHTH